jgi:hypothetical protein
MADGSTVTSTIEASGVGQDMYSLCGVHVTGKHLVHDKSYGWTSVEKHPGATSCPDHDGVRVYCLCTSSKTIRINGCVFGDWDDITQEQSVNAAYSCGHLADTLWDDGCIHRYLEGGFAADTPVDIDDGRSIPIKDIGVGHVLRFGEIVTGVVESDGGDVRGVQKYYLGDVTVTAGPNFVVDYPEMGPMSSFAVQSEPARCRKLYHLLTNERSFHIRGLRFGDFDTRLERFVEGERPPRCATANFYL